MSFYEDDQLRLLLGDARDRLAEIEPGTTQAIVTSPPYFGLRDYGTAEWEGGDDACDHEGSMVRAGAPGSAKQASNRGANHVASGNCRCGARRVDRQIGLEDSVNEYVAELVAVFAAAREKLSDTGTLWLNVGDSYAGSAASSGHRGTTEGDAYNVRGRQEPGVRSKAGDGLLGVPWKVAEALRDDGWRLVRDVIWAKTNAMPESARNRPSTAHEYVFMFAKGRRHFYAHRTDKHQRSVWAGPTAGFGEAHFAVMPDWLATRCILLGSKRDDVILDPFAGSGTTLCQALSLGRRAIGVELNEQNCAMVLRRVGIAKIVDV